MKLNIFLILILVGLKLQAQTKKGQKMIQFEDDSYFVRSKYSSGNINDKFYSFSTGKTSNSKVLLRYGKFITDNNLLGLGFLLDRKSEYYAYDNNINGINSGVAKAIKISIDISPYYRRYMGKSNKYQFFSELMLNVAFSSFKNKVSSNLDNNRITLYPIFGVGLDYYINKRLVLEVNTKTSLSPIELQSINSQSINLSLIYLTGTKGRVFKSDSIDFNRGKKWILGGGFYLDNIKQNIEKQHSQSFVISAGRFINQKLFLGTNVELNLYSKNDSNKQSENNFSITSKYYFYKTRFTPVLTGTLNGDIFKKTISNPVVTQVSFGLAYFINKKWLLEADLYSGRFNFRKDNKNRDLTYINKTGLHNIQLKYVF
jgi:hypothetical protein